MAKNNETDRTRIAVLETNYKHLDRKIAENHGAVMNGMEEIKNLLKTNNDDHKEMKEDIVDIKQRVTINEQKVLQALKKSDKTHDEVECVKERLNIHDSKLLNVSSEQQSQNTFLDKIKWELIRVSLTGGAVAAIFKGIAVLSRAI